MCLAYSNIKGNSDSGSHDTDDNGSSFLVSAPEEAMATHSSTLAWKIPWRGAWKAAVHGVAKS